MKISLIILGILVAGTVAAFAMNSSSEPELQLRYKITINVQAPEGVKSGSAVREIVIDKFKGWNPDKADFNSDIYGEAVVVNLGDQKLFGLLDWDSYNEVFYAFPSGTAPLSKEGIAFYKNLEVGQTASLENKNHWPKFFTFKNLNNPISIRPVNQGDLSEILGSSLKIQSIKIELTDEQITKNISNILPWLDELQGGYLHGGKTSRGAPFGLYGLNFKKEKKS